ncbi:MAG: hypothetical protein Q8Q46_03600 [Candidatus Giovannonibacteria bacterium]|nr:hypothetical protein [Candidatus Giovannonibacteria bacterium]
MTWTKNKIKEGFDKFYQEHGRYPTALEIDAYVGLPSSRQMQRRFGGLPKLRQELNLDTLDFTKGSVRSQTAQYIGKRGLDFEKVVRKILVDKFGIDVFFASDRHNLMGCINSKQRLYKNFVDKLILLQLNPKIDQKIIDQYLSNKENALPSNASVLSLDKFLEFIQTIQPLQVS